MLEEEYLFKQKYNIKYCELCGVYRILCPHCLNTSCSCGGCDKCDKDVQDFNKLNIDPKFYLTKEEEDIIEKYKFIKKHLPIFLERGKDFNYEILKKEGHTSKYIEKIFEKHTES